MFFWNCLAFLMIQQMLAIWSLLPLPFLKPAWTSESSRFMYCWSLAWRILSVNYSLMSKIKNTSYSEWKRRGRTSLVVQGLGLLIGELRSLMPWGVANFFFFFKERGEGISKPKIWLYNKYDNTIKKQESTNENPVMSSTKQQQKQALYKQK